MKKNIQEIATELCDKFLEENFVVQRYDAHSTQSIYIKLDYGVSNTIRLSDHKGYDYLSYKYNIRMDISKDYVEKDKNGYIRYYIAPQNIDTFIQHTIRERETRIRRIGLPKYKEWMKRNYDTNNETPGFWSKCKEIRRKSNGTKRVTARYKE